MWVCIHLNKLACFSYDRSNCCLFLLYHNAPPVLDLALKKNIRFPGVIRHLSLQSIGLYRIGCANVVRLNPQGMKLMPLTFNTKKVRLNRIIASLMKCR